MLDLITALQVGLQKKEEQRHAWDKSAIHVTDLAITLGGDDGTCPLAVWMRLRGYARKPETLGKMLMFDNAHSLHERTAELLKLGLPADEWVVESIEESVGKHLPRRMKGRLDVKLRHIHTGVVLVVDIKTVRGSAFNFLKEPKRAHVLQVQTYCMAVNAHGGLIVYVDREGQNAAVQFPVPRNDKRVIDAMARTHRILDADTPPDVLRPVVSRRSNKTRPDSVELSMPWQCRYCDLLDVSCRGALPPTLRELGIVARVNKDGTASWCITPPEGTKISQEEGLLVMDIVNEYLRTAAEPEPEHPVH